LDANTSALDKNTASSDALLKDNQKAAADKKSAKKAASDKAIADSAAAKSSATGISSAVGGFLSGVEGGGTAPDIILHGPDGSIMFQSNLSSEVAGTGIPALMQTLMGFMGAMAGLFFVLREIL